MTDQEFVPIEVDSQDLFQLIEAHGGSAVFDLMFETGDEVVDLNRMSFTMTLAMAYVDNPHAVTDEQIEFFVSAVARDKQLWSFYYLAEPYEHVDAGLIPRDVVDKETREEAIEAGEMGEVSGFGILNRQFEWAYRPEFYNDFTDKQQEFALLVHTLLNPAALGQAALDANDRRLDDRVLDLKVRDGEVKSGRYGEQGLWNIFGNNAPLIRSSDFAAAPSQYIPEQYGGDPDQQMLDFMDTYTQFLLAGAVAPAQMAGKAVFSPSAQTVAGGGAKSVGILTSDDAAAAAAKGFTGRAVTRFVAPEYMPSMMTQQMMWYGSKLSGLSEAAWFQKVSTGLSKAYRVGAKWGALGTLSVGSLATAIDTYRNLTVPDVVSQREAAVVLSLPSEMVTTLEGPTGAIPAAQLAPGSPVDVSDPRFYGPGNPQGLTPAEQVSGVTPFDSVHSVTGEPTEGQKYEDNPYVGFEDKRYLQFTQTGEPLLDQTRRRGPTASEEKLLMAGQITIDDPRFLYQSMPEWRVKDIENELSNMTPDDLDWFQAKAIEAGVINPDSMDYFAGSTVGATRRAMETVMDAANRSKTKYGIDWRKQLEEMARLNAQDDDETTRRYVKPTYLKMDPAQAADFARTEIRNELGRDINDWEMAMITDQMKSDHRSLYENQVQADYQNWLAVGRAEEEDLEYVEAGEDAQDVDWRARAREMVQDKFGNEIKRRRTTTEVAQETPDLMTGLRRGMAAMG